MDAITVRGLRKTYTSRGSRGGEPVRVEAVRGIDLVVGTGEIVALLGPNGAGKTTTVEILEGVRRRDAGDVRVLGTDPSSADASWRERVGIVWQTTGAFDDLTVREVVRHFAGLYRRPRPVDEVIERVGLAGKADERTGRLSGGQRRRLDVALGIVGRPEVLFLDEPTTGFDPAARRHFWELVHALRDEGTTMVLTTHYLEEAEALCHRIGMLKQGRLVALDRTSALLAGTASTMLRFKTDDALPPAVAEHARVTGRIVQVTAHDAAEVETVLATLRGAGVRIEDLEIGRADLEDVFLEIMSGSHPPRMEVAA